MLLKWLNTPRGRQFIQGTALTTSGLALAAYYLPNTFFLNKVQDLVQTYEYGEGKKLSPKVLQLYEQVLDDMKIPKYERELIKPFTMYGFETFYAGSTALRTGAIVGIPDNFNYESELDVDRRIKVGTKPVIWESSAGLDLQNSLLLSDSAKKFAIAREVYCARSSLIWMFTLLPSCCILGTYLLSANLNDRLRLREKPSSLRVIMYGLVSSLFLTLYFGLKDGTRVYLDETADEAIAQISKDYAKGGVEFYKKLLERNKALRSILGDYGEKLYSVNGNDVMFIRTKHKPVITRKLFMEEIVNNYNKDSQ